MEESDRVVWIVISAVLILFLISMMIAMLMTSNKATETACNSTLSYEQKQLDENFKVCKDRELEASKGIWPGIERGECFNPSTPSP